MKERTGGRKRYSSVSPVGLPSTQNTVSRLNEVNRFGSGRIWLSVLGLRTLSRSVLVVSRDRFGRLVLVVLGGTV